MTSRKNVGRSAVGRKGKGGRHLGRQPHCTPNEMKVIDEYFLNGFVKYKAFQAVYTNQSDSSSRGNTWQFFTRPWVKEEIERRMKSSRQRFDVSQETLVQELAAIGFARLSNLLDVQEDGTAVVNLKNLGEAERAAISEITVDEYQEGHGEEARPVKKVKIKLHDKNAALEKLMRHMGLFKDKVEHGVEQSLADLLIAGRNRVSTEKPE